MLYFFLRSDRCIAKTYSRRKMRWKTWLSASWPMGKRRIRCTSCACSASVVVPPASWDLPGECRQCNRQISQALSTAREFAWLCNQRHVCVTWATALCGCKRCPHRVLKLCPKMCNAWESPLRILIFYQYSQSNWYSSFPCLSVSVQTYM